MEVLFHCFSVSMSSVKIQPGSLPKLVTDLAFWCPIAGVKDHHKEHRQL